MFIKKIKKHIVVMVSLLLCVAMMSGISVSAVEYWIDNDDAQGYSNINNGFNTKLSGSNLYLGDARLSSPSSSSNSYYYVYPSPGVVGVDYMSLSWGVHLNSSRFTDTASIYYIQIAYLQYARAGVINQRTAPGGWSYYSATIKSSYADGGFITRDFYIVPSNNSSTETGADGIYLNFNN